MIVLHNIKSGQGCIYYQIWSMITQVRTFTWLQRLANEARIVDPNYDRVMDQGRSLMNGAHNKCYDGLIFSDPAMLRVYNTLNDSNYFESFSDKCKNSIFWLTLYIRIYTVGWVMSLFALAVVILEN